MERESNMTLNDIRKHSEQAKKLCEQKTAIDMAAMESIKEVLKTCENHTLSFSDKEDDDENFTINVPTDYGEMENLLVDSIRMEKNDAILLNADGRDFWIWETDKSATEIYQYMMDEIEFEFINNQK